MKLLQSIFALSLLVLTSAPTHAENAGHETNRATSTKSGSDSPIKETISSLIIKELRDSFKRDFNYDSNEVFKALTTRNYFEKDKEGKRVLPGEIYSLLAEEMYRKEESAAKVLYQKLMPYRSISDSEEVKDEVKAIIEAYAGTAEEGSQDAKSNKEFSEAAQKILDTMIAGKPNPNQEIALFKLVSKTLEKNPENTMALKTYSLLAKQLTDGQKFSISRELYAERPKLLDKFSKEISTSLDKHAKETGNTEFSDVAKMVVGFKDALNEEYEPVIEKLDSGGGKFSDPGCAACNMGESPLRKVAKANGFSYRRPNLSFIEETAPDGSKKLFANHRGDMLQVKDLSDKGPQYNGWRYLEDEHGNVEPIDVKDSTQKEILKELDEYYAEKGDKNSPAHKAFTQRYSKHLKSGSIAQSGKKADDMKTADSSKVQGTPVQNTSKYPAKVAKFIDALDKAIPKVEEKDEAKRKSASLKAGFDTVESLLKEAGFDSKLHVTENDEDEQALLKWARELRDDPKNKAQWLALLEKLGIQEDYLVETSQGLNSFVKSEMEKNKDLKPLSVDYDLLLAGTEYDVENATELNNQLKAIELKLQNGLSSADYKKAKAEAAAIKEKLAPASLRTTFLEESVLGVKHPKELKNKVLLALTGACFYCDNRLWDTVSKDPGYLENSKLND